MLIVDYLEKMSNLRKLRIITLKSEALSLEEEEYEELNSICVNEFNKEFHLEVAYAHEVNENEETSVDSQDSVSNKDDDFPDEVLKKIHKKLAMITHPDLNPDDDESEEEFKKIQEAYEQRNGPLLLREALKRKVEVDLNDRDIHNLESQLSDRRNLLKYKKSTCAWVWFNSNREESGLRSRIRMSMGIDENLFNEWVKNKK